MFYALYQIIITPLVDLTEFFYQLFYEITGNQGISVIGLSFVVTIFTLPLYMVAEKWQEKERKTQEKLKPGIERIKSTFKGDEQYMILSVFYKENHYHPLMALRSSFSLLIQVPFFIAAYNFLSGLEPLNEYSFLFIKSFGEPDSTFHIGSFAVNVLPVAMTLINCVSGAVYSKGHPLSEKIQIYACAAVFLLLLYNSPAGLVVYWTMNNVLSLVKNVFYKLKNPAKTLYILACLFAAVIFIFAFLADTKKIIRTALVLFAVLIPFIPFICKNAAKFISSNFVFLDGSPKNRNLIFILSALCLSLLAGLVIPSTLMQSEVSQYCNVDSYKSPWIFLLTPFFQSLGFFVFWPACFYFLFGKQVKKAFCLIFSAFVFTAVFNTFLFGGNYGPINPTLIFMEPQTFKESLSKIIINAAGIAAILFFVLIITSKKAVVIQYLCSILALSFSAVSVKNVFDISSFYGRMDKNLAKDEVESVFHLSKTGKNVIVLMQDRLFSPLIPFVFDELPELKEKFDGFTFYKNTMSFAIYTMLGTPGIFGGYDYTPYEMNTNPKQKDKTLQQKHNEAIVSLPKTFNASGWNTAVSDMPYENYLEQPSDSFYNDEHYKVTNENNAASFSRIQTHGVYSDLWYKKNNMEPLPFISSQIKRNFFIFSIFKMVSPVLRPVVYHNDYWLSFNKYNDTAKFIDNYSELDFLPQLVDFNSENNAFLLLDNEATHEPIFLQAPAYVPAEKVTDYGRSPFCNQAQYHSMAGVFSRLARFFDYLKENDCYDNTRIIIVSDHGTNIDTGDFEKTQEIDISKQNYTASLLVKDFNEKGPVKEDMTFMTNADTPYLAVKDLIENASNPFTGSLYRVENKNDYMKLVKAPAQSTRIRHDNAFSVPEDGWYTVHDNIFLNENWAHLNFKESAE